jgi:Arc/MetJ-type ribon-helix-helix transcriptional regulator
MSLSKDRDRQRKREERQKETPVRSAEDTWQTDSFSLEPGDPISKLMSLKPYKRSEDKKGHGVFLGGWFPKEISRDIEEIKEFGPYKTNSDVVRDAVYRGLQVLKLAYEEDESWQAEMLLSKMANDAEWESRIYEQEDDFVSSLDRLCRNGDRDYASQLLQERIQLMRRSADSARRLNVLTEKLRRNRLDDLLEV